MSDRIDSLLGDVKLTHHTFSLIGEPDVEVKIRPMAMKHFKVLLKSSEGVVRDERLLADPEEVRKIDSSFDEVLRDCIVEPKDLDPTDLFIADWLYLLVMLRAVSKGNIVDFELPCPGTKTVVTSGEDREYRTPVKCNHIIKRSINLNELEKMPKSKFENLSIDLDEDIKVFLSPPKRKDDYELIDYIQEHNGEISEAELVFLKFSTCINRVKRGKKIIKDLNLEEKRKLFEAFSYEQKENLSESYHSLSFGLPTFVELRCSECGYTSEERLVNLADFFTL